MSQQLPKGISRIYKINFLHAFAFGYLTSSVTNGVDLDEAAAEIQRHFNHDEETMPRKSIIIAYRRTQQKFLSEMRAEGSVGAVEENFPDCPETMVDLIKQSVSDPLIQAVEAALKKYEER